jgi:hypothetical protein
MLSSGKQLSGDVVGYHGDGEGDRATGAGVDAAALGGGVAGDLAELGATGPQGGPRVSSGLTPSSRMPPLVVAPETAGGPAS